MLTAGQLSIEIPGQVTPPCPCNSPEHVKASLGSFFLREGFDASGESLNSWQGRIKSGSRDGLELREWRRGKDQGPQVQGDSGVFIALPREAGGMNRGCHPLLFKCIVPDQPAVEGGEAIFIGAVVGFYVGAMSVRWCLARKDAHASWAAGP